MIVKYGKPYGDIAGIKENFLRDNAMILKFNDEIRDVYRKQPIRKVCKICGGGG